MSSVLGSKMMSVCSLDHKWSPGASCIVDSIIEATYCVGVPILRHPNTASALPE
jgi:hypothetical protein